MIYRPKHFVAQEFVPEHVYQARGNKALELMDPHILEMADLIKEKFNRGTATINNWSWGGDRNWSGLRTPESPYYRPYSQHTFGRAVDVVFSDYSAEEVRRYIFQNEEKFPYINFVEMSVNWLHMDCRNCSRITKYIP